MKDPSGALRRAVAEALEGNISYNASAVAVYDGQVLSDGDSLYVLLSSENTTDASSKSDFATDISLLLEITHRPEYAIDSEVLEDIFEQVMGILKPDPQTDGISDTSDFQFIGFRLESGNKLNLAISTTNSIHRKLLTLSCRAYQLN